MVNHPNRSKVHRIHVIRPGIGSETKGSHRATYCGLKGFYDLAHEYDTANGDRFEAIDDPKAATCKSCRAGWEAWHDKRGSL